MLLNKKIHALFATLALTTTLSPAVASVSCTQAQLKAAVRKGIREALEDYAEIQKEKQKTYLASDGNSGTTYSSDEVEMTSQEAIQLAASPFEVYLSGKQTPDTATRPYYTDPTDEERDAGIPPRPSYSDQYNYSFYNTKRSPYGITRSTHGIARLACTCEEVTVSRKRNSSFLIKSKAEAFSVITTTRMHCSPEGQNHEIDVLSVFNGNGVLIGNVRGSEPDESNFYSDNLD